MDLPQMPDQQEAQRSWKQMILKLQGFLEKSFDRRADIRKIEAALQASNRKNALVQKIFDYAALTPSVLNWKEMYDVCFLALPSTYEEMQPILEDLLQKLELRVQEGAYIAPADAPRVMVTGCPIGGDATKIFKVIEAAGGVVVAPDSCTGLKPFMNLFAENTDDPVGALAARYLKLPCACMTPNDGRLSHLSVLIERFKPDVVIDFVLQACHGYSVESYKVGKHVQENHGLPFLKVETDYSDGDTEQLKTRIEALFECIR
jgi:benzoyl-CoA reductase/2-hydroxyglutaryl-CoA dehydratase subunit BcrC/BadD/HgdB